MLDLDPNTIGGVTTSISGVTISGGRDTGTCPRRRGHHRRFGTAATGDHLTISNSTITNNHTSGRATSGGGMQFIGGVALDHQLDLQRQLHGRGAGSGVFYQARGTASGEGLTVSGTTFSGNSAATPRPTPRSVAR